MLGKIDSPLNQKLAQVKWGEFKVEELFEIQKISNMLSQNQVQDSIGFPVYSSESSNNGIIGYTNNPEFICDDEHPIYITFGDHTRTLNIAQKSFSVLDNVKVLLPRINNVRVLIFIISVWKKQIPNLGYSRHWKVAKNSIINLPVKNGKIDFEFIDGFVAELEDQRVAELEDQRVAELQAYLSLTGFDSFELTEQEKSTINNIDKIEWKSYKLGDLFDRIPTKKLPYKAKELPGYPIKDYILPCLTSSFKNQGLNYYVPKSGATTLKNVISILSNSDVYRAYFQSNEFTVLSDAYAIHWKEKSEHISQNQYLFMVMSINKVTNLPIYSYKNKLGGWNVVKHKKILLPTTNGKIDFSFMDEFISAIKKLHLKSVADFTDKKIALTKQVISKS